MASGRRPHIGRDVRLHLSRNTGPRSTLPPRIRLLHAWWVRPLRCGKRSKEVGAVWLPAGDSPSHEAEGGGFQDEMLVLSLPTWLRFTTGGTDPCSCSAWRPSCRSVDRRWPWSLPPPTRPCEKTSQKINHFVLLSPPLGLGQTHGLAWLATFCR